MQDELVLQMLKQDLEILHSKNEAYLLQLIYTAKKMIAREGIVLGTDYDDQALVVMYAAWMYRKRASNDSAMPRMLRSSLNSKLVSQKAVVEDV